MSERPRQDEEPPQRPEPPPETGYTVDEEAEVQKRLEDLGYVE
jgi:hypothetical protein